MLVYWIHYKEHTDPYTEGYIGVTNNLERRLTEHTSVKSKCHHVKNRINNGAIVSVLHHVSSIDEALALELEYRPEEYIGWNICEGGGMPPKQTGEFLDTNRLRGDDRTAAQKEAAVNHSLKMKGRSVWNKDKKGLQSAWNKGIENPKMKEMATIHRECPHCGKHGKGSSMLRWHFDNCKFKVGI
jgi:predicted GIY-YIG superfamily endonuclease